MRYKTLFRLGVKLIGLATMSLGAVLFAHWFFRVFDTISGPVLSIDSIDLLAGPTVAFAIGLYLFFRGQWIVNLAIPSNRPYCPECGFDLSGQQRAAVCSECGTPIPADVLRQIKKAPGSADERIPPESEEP